MRIWKRRCTGWLNARGYVDMVSILDIIGPVMIGPSSSHTAGANRLARVSGQIYGRPFDKVIFNLFGSFAGTYIGHGTDKALVAGILGMREDDVRIRKAPEIAKEQGITVVFKLRRSSTPGGHDLITVFEDCGQRPFAVAGNSIGGGRISITQVDGIQTFISAGKPTLVLTHADENGVISRVTAALAAEGINIAAMRTDRQAVGGRAMSVLELDGDVSENTLESIRALREIEKLSEIG